MLTEKEVIPKPRKKRWLLLIAIVTLLLFAVVGVLIKQFADLYGFDVVSKTVKEFAQQMRIVRPLLFLILFCFWPPVIGFASRMRILTDGQSRNLLQNRNRFFLWVALLEVTMGQGQVVTGVIVLVSILIYPWFMNVWKGIRVYER